MDIDSNGRRMTLKRATQRQSKRKRASKTSIESKESTEIHKPAAQRVFLYIQLQDIQQLPETPYPVELHLYHVKNTLTKMQEHYTTDTIIFQHEFGLHKPSFTLSITQDSIEDLNTLSDHPLIITLYQRIPRHRKGELKTLDNILLKPSAWKMTALATITDSNPAAGDFTGTTTITELPTYTTTTQTSKELISKKSTTTGDVTKSTEVSTIAEGSKEEVDEEDATWIAERLEFISRGHCDLLQLFQHKRFISNIEVYLYPQYDRKLEELTVKKITTQTEWHMYSVLPMLKLFTFTNLAFITLESIYNAPEQLLERAANLGMSLSFRATEPDIDGDHLIVPLCTYYGFGSHIISAQNTSIVWETIKRDFYSPKGFGNNQMETNSRIKLPRLFRQLLYTEGVDFKINDIDPVLDHALINNSMHRYVLTNEMRIILEAAVVHNHFELLLELYYETPKNVLYDGIIKLSVFGYPFVNYCRFATTLKPAARTSSLKSGLFGSAPSLDGPLFAIVKICFFQPITQRNENLDSFNEDLQKRGKLRRCFDLEFLHEEEDDRDIVKELYRAFNNLISEIIAFIVKRDIHSIEERRDYFCCQLGNLNNLLLKICGCDFNVRMPTKTNIEFREMLTHMYKELMDRVYNILMDCGRESLSHCVVNYEAEQMRIISIMEEYRFMCILGDVQMADMVYEELKNTIVNKMLFNFYVFLNHVENLNFNAASAYLLQDRDWDGEYFAALVQLYINYQLELQSEETASEAYANLLEELRIFTSKNPLDQDAWILHHCYYKNNKYLPGMEYTRWKFENLYDVPRKNLAYAPRSLYELYLPNDCELSTNRGNKFYRVFKLFARLGAYAFAEVVFNDIAKDCSAIDAYLISTTLKMLQKQIGKAFKVRTFQTDNSVRGKLMRYYLAHINGNVEFSRDRIDEAINQFKHLLSITEPDMLQIFYLSLLRLARLAFERGDYALAKQAYELCLPLDKTRKNFMANYGMGLSLYYMNQLEDAIEYLARCTEADLFVPDVWGYLATINLRLNRNKTALDCWKMAKIYPEMRMTDAIYAELDKIQCYDVTLMVDDDGNEEEQMEKIDFII